MKKSMIGLLSLVLLTSCATTYQKEESGFFHDGMGGYSDTQISEDQFRISYKGSGMDSSPFMNLFSESGNKNIRANALRRAGEIARTNHFHYFMILSEKMNRVPGDGAATYYHVVTLEIKCYRENPPAGAIDCNDAIHYQMN